MAKVKCPKCKSYDIQPLGGTNKRTFSVGKAIAGNLLLPGIGTLAGVKGKKNNYDCFCKDCGHRFKIK